METLQSEPVPENCEGKKLETSTDRLEKANNAISLTSDGKNEKHIKCSRCPSTILIPEMAALVTCEFSLPNMKKKSKNDQDEGLEESKQFWCVDNMYAFENIGFSKTVDGVKYLICADCEIGPIGYHDLETKLSYVSLSRVQNC